MVVGKQKQHPAAHLLHVNTRRCKSPSGDVGKQASTRGIHPTASQFDTHHAEFSRSEQPAIVEPFPREARLLFTEKEIENMEDQSLEPKLSSSIE